MTLKTAIRGFFGACVRVVAGVAKIIITAAVAAVMVLFGLMYMAAHQPQGPAPKIKVEQPQYPVRQYDEHPDPVTFSRTLDMGSSTAAPGLTKSQRMERMLRATVYVRTKDFLGSGVVVDNRQCLVLTNNHVISEGGELWVKYITGRRADGVAITTRADATVVGRPSGAADLALIKLASCKGLPWVPLAAEADIRSGDPVIAVGQPRGLAWTVSHGIVSNPHQYIGARWAKQGFLLLQTDAAINHGNSGGPLYNPQGYLLGINSLTREGDNNLGFDHGVAQVGNFLAWMKAWGKMPDFTFGVALKADTTTVKEVADQSLAAAVGLKAGDDLISLNGVRLYDALQLKRLMFEKGVEAPVKLKVRRNGKTVVLTFNVTSTLAS